MADKQIKVRILPLHNIGGVGNAGAVVWMMPEDAEMYFRDGYVEYISDEPLAVSEGQEAKAPEMQEHAVMKPEVKRAKKVVRKK